jgi:hypothetical protein
MRLWWLGAVLLAVGVSADAQEFLSPPPADPSPITDHLAFRAIYFFGKVDTEGQFNGNNNVVGTRINAENEFGLTDRADQFRAELIVRLEQRTRLRVSFLDLRRQGDRILNQTLQFGNQTFQIGQQVKSEFNYRQMEVAHTYSLLRGEWYELGVGLAVQLAEAEADAAVPATPKFQNFSGAGVFGTPLIDGSIRLIRHWSLNVRGQYLRVSVHNVAGLLEDYHGDLQYRWRRPLAFGVGYEWQNIERDVNSNNGNLRLKISGPEAFVRASY